MIELIVKTLDSQNHGFSVPDDTTVKQLKDKISESINIPADSQRLIYCGRVLVDEKNLSEYDVNGKVIHLVHRPPPQPSRQNGNSTGNRTSNQQHRHSNQHRRTARMDGNAMYLGAMAFPADLMDAQGIQPPQPSHNLSQSRLLVARRMVRRASAVLQRLQSPRSQESPDPETPPPEDNDSGSAINGENGTNSNNVLPQAQPFAGSIAQAAQAATAAAIAAAVSAAHAAGVPNITIVRGGQPQGSQESVNIRIDGNEEGGRNEQDPQVSSSENASAPEGNNSSTPQQQTSDSSSAASNENQTRRPEPPRPNDMASLLNELNRVTESLQPYLQQYHQLMRDDPVFEADSPALREAQRTFNTVSEVMHFLSHAYHAMSDIMCDFSSAPPRNLRCRPVLIQHSAVLQAGIPIQAQINVLANRSQGNNGSQQQSSQTENENSSSTNTSTNIPEPTTNEATTPATAGEVTVTSTETPATSGNQTQSSPQTQQSRPNVTQGYQTQGFSPSFNIAPGNVEFFMEVGPGSITIDSLEATVVTNGSSNGGQNGADSNAASGNFPWGSPPPSDFIQNLMQAVAGHMMGRASGAPSSNGTTQPAASAGASAGGQNSQARGNTATHPTTSTQTRSTSRPHVHLASPTVPGLGSTNFDPFLPCNSHHVRTFRRRQRAHQAQQQQQQQQQAASTEPQAEAQAAEQSSEQSPPQQDSSSHPTPQSQTQSQSQPQPQPQSQTQSQQSQIPPGQGPNLFDLISNLIGNMPEPPRPQSQTQGQSQPQAQSQSQSQSQQQSQVPPQQPRNLFDIISNVMGNIQDGGAIPGMPMGSFTFPMPPPPQSAGMGSGIGNQPPSLPPFFLNMMGGLGASGAGEIPPFNMGFQPELSQLLQAMSSLGRRGISVQTSGGTTLADLLQFLPEHSYTEGESIFTDLVMTLARSLTFQDLFAMHFGQVHSLNRIRPRLRTFISQRILEGGRPTPENINQAANRLIREMRPHFNVVLEARLREEVDLIATINQYNQIRLPEVITLIMAEGNDNNFGQQLIQWYQTYTSEMCAILLHCCVDGAQGLETIIQHFVQRFTSGINVGTQQWTVGSTLTHLRNYIQDLDVPFENIQRYLVYRIPGTAEPPVAPQSARVQQTHADTEQAEACPAPEPMETDVVVPDTVQANSPVRNIEEQDQMDTNGLPEVIIGSESWHDALPSEWVPIIARDTQRQRRQYPQPPFSDAYLAGMPSKRRKIVTSAKPQGSLSQIIADGVSNAVEAAGVDAVTGLETVTQVAGNDPEIQTAYREQVRTTVRDSLARNPDFTPERFPNTAKYFK